MHRAIPNWRRRRRRSGGTLALALALAVGGGLVGCGSSSDSGGPEDAFIGRWIQEPPNATSGTGFTLTCTDPMFATDFTGPLLIWDNLTFEKGVLTGLTETGGGCSILNWNLSSDGKSAGVANPDPYIGDAPACIIEFTFGIDPVTGAPIPAALVIEPPATPGWSFTLLDEKSPVGAPQGSLVGSAPALILVDNNTPTGIVSTPPCTYAGMDKYFRLTQP
jgi:hypothetical protein